LSYCSARCIAARTCHRNASRLTTSWPFDRTTIDIKIVAAESCRSPTIEGGSTSSTDIVQPFIRWQAKEIIQRTARRCRACIESIAEAVARHSATGSTEAPVSTAKTLTAKASISKRPGIAARSASSKTTTVPSEPAAGTAKPTAQTSSINSASAETATKSTAAHTTATNASAAESTPTKPAPLKATTTAKSSAATSKPTAPAAKPTAPAAKPASATTTATKAPTTTARKTGGNRQVCNNHDRNNEKKMAFHLIMSKAFYGEQKSARRNATTAVDCV
jgi:hypothetical protein